MSMYSGGDSGMYPICFLTAWGSSRMSCPSSFTEPSVADRYPVMMFIVVDFPAPLGPRNPRISPRFTVKFRRSTASRCPYFFVTFSTCIKAFSFLSGCARLSLSLSGGAAV